jgi:hypothetical protein
MARLYRERESQQKSLTEPYCFLRRVREDQVLSPSVLVYKVILNLRLITNSKFQ